MKISPMGSGTEYLIRRRTKGEIKHLVPDPSANFIEPGGVNYVLGLTKIEERYLQLIEAITPQGALT